MPRPVYDRICKIYLSNRNKIILIHDPKYYINHGHVNDNSGTVFRSTFALAHGLMYFRRTGLRNDEKPAGERKQVEGTGTVAFVWPE